MTRVVWLRRVGDARMRLCAEGHAGAGAYGEDIVCAAVSTAMEMLESNLLVFGCRRGGRKGPGLFAVDGEGYTAYKLMDATASFLRALAYQYPENLRFTEKIWEKGDTWGENDIEAGL